jgi:hypothetical protein
MRRGSERCAKYLEWIRTLNCLVCQCAQNDWWIEAAHTAALGPRGLRQKTSDFSAVPLCANHHRFAPDSYHALGERSFAQRHGLDLVMIVQGLIEAYRRPVGSTYE